MDKIQERNIDFTVFCIESYKNAHSITGKQALEIFDEYNVFDYITLFYDVMHSTGQGYVVEDIDKYIYSRKN